MKKVFIPLVFFVLFPFFLTAQNVEEKRRVEEEKRQDLRPSEVQIPKETKKPPEMLPIDTSYFTGLAFKKITFGYDACKTLVMLMGGEEKYIDLDSQVAFLKEKKLLPKKFISEFDPMQPLRKGLTAYMFCKTLGLKGGFSLRLFGLNQRYALKEMVFAGIMFPGNVHDIVSGEELISVFMLATDYIQKKKQIQSAKPQK